MRARTIGNKSILLMQLLWIPLLVTVLFGIGMLGAVGARFARR